MIINNKVYFMPDVSVNCFNEAGLLAEFAAIDPFQDAIPCWQRGELMLRSPYTYMTPRKTKAK